MHCHFLLFLSVFVKVHCCSLHVPYLTTACTQGCPQYWPEEGMLRYGPVQVECMSCSMDCDVISRLFRVCNLTRVSRFTLCCYIMVSGVFLCDCRSNHNSSLCDLPASGRLPDGSSVPVPGLGGA